MKKFMGNAKGKCGNCCCFFYYFDDQTIRSWIIYDYDNESIKDVEENVRKHKMENPKVS